MEVGNVCDTPWYGIVSIFLLSKSYFFSWEAFSFFRANSPHWVRTAEPSVMIGTHLFVRWMKRTFSNIVHIFVQSYAITNTDHPSVRTELWKMMDFWVLVYKEGYPEARKFPSLH